MCLPMILQARLPAARSHVAWEAYLLSMRHKCDNSLGQILDFSLEAACSVGLANVMNCHEVAMEAVSSFAARRIATTALVYASLEEAFFDPTPNRKRLGHASERQWIDHKGSHPSLSRSCREKSNAN